MGISDWAGKMSGERFLVIIEEEDLVKVGFGRVQGRSERLRVLWAFQSAVLEGKGEKKD